MRCFATDRRPQERQLVHPNVRLGPLLQRVLTRLASERLTHTPGGLAEERIQLTYNGAPNKPADVPQALWTEHMGEACS